MCSFLLLSWTLQKKNKKNKCWTTQPDAQHFRYDVAAAAPQRHTPTQYSIRQEDGGRLPEVKNRRLKDIRAGYSSRRPVALNERALVETEHSHGDNLFEPLGKWRPAIKNAWMSGGTLSLRCWLNSHKQTNSSRTHEFVWLACRVGMINKLDRKVTDFFQASPLQHNGKRGRAKRERVRTPWTPQLKKKMWLPHNISTGAAWQLAQITH